MAIYLVNPLWAGDGNDHGQNIIDFIKTVPDGTPLAQNRILFARNAVSTFFRSEKKILLTLRNYLVIDLDGCTVGPTIVEPYTADGSGFYPNTRADLVAGLNRGRSVFELDKCTNVRITSTSPGGTLQGAGPGAPNYVAKYEAQNGVNITGGDAIEIDHVKITNVYGDWVQSNRSDTTVVGGQKMPDNIHVHDCVMRNCSRQGITDAASTSSYIVENNDIANGARHCIDLENDDPHGTIPIVGFTFRANKVGHFKLGFIACAGNSQVVDKITIGGLTPADGNTLVGQSMDMIMQSSPVWKVDGSGNFILDGNGKKIRAGGYWRNTNLLVGWNTSDTSFGQHPTPGNPVGEVLAQGWDGVTIINNNALCLVGAGQQGVLLDNCTGYQGNIHSNIFKNASNEWIAINPVTVTPPPPPPITGWDAGKYDDGTYDDSTIVAPPSTVPGPPRNVTVTGADSSVLITWTTPTTDGGQPITNWVVTSYLGTVPQTTISVPVGPLLTTDVTAVNGRTYTYTVRALNSVGAGADSTHSAPVTPVAPATAPAAPVITSVVGADSFVGVVWTAPANGGAPISAYVIRLYIAGAAQAPQFVAAPQTFVFAPAVNGTTYTVTVQAVNAVGNSAESTPSGSVTPAAAGTGGGSAPDTPTGVTAQPGDGQAIVFWGFPNDGGSVITGYTVTPFIAGVAQTPFPVTGSFPATTVTGLTNGTAYTFKVTATNVNGTSGQSTASSPVTPTAAVVITAPSVPTNLKVTGGDGQAIVQWDIPANGGNPIVSYTVTTYVDGISVDTDIVPAGLPFIFLLLTNDVTYRFTVIATNSTGSSAESAFSSPVTPESTVIIPPPPPPPPSTFSPGWTFTPPVEFVVSPISEEAPALSNRLFRHYQSGPRGKTIWELPDGTLTFSQPFPTVEDTGANRATLHSVGSDEWSNLTAVTYERVFLGGHVYEFGPDDPFLDVLRAFLTDQGYDWQDWIKQETLAWILTSYGQVLGGLGGIMFVRKTGG